MTTQSLFNRLILQDGSVFEGEAFGFPGPVAGEVVFNTGMVGYPEAFTDPSYKGQILVLTYPLVGNYGVAAGEPDFCLDGSFESSRVQIAGLIVSEISGDYHHWNASQSLADWLKDQEVPALSGVDTRALTKHLRQSGSTLGNITSETHVANFYDPNQDNLVARVSVRSPITHRRGRKRAIVIDCGCKSSIIRNLLHRDISVTQVPWDYDFLGEDFNGIVISNGPGDPKMCAQTIANVRRAMERGYPVFGICLGNQILALAGGGDTYKLKYGHRGQNQPCIEVGTKRCYITSQNHGYAVDMRTLPPGWEPWFSNANDDTNEGIRHCSKPFRGVQFHPEAAPGPVDTDFLFDEFQRIL
jgi:carbamoyl-phosphate synthase small subunit